MKNLIKGPFTIGIGMNELVEFHRKRDRFDEGYFVIAIAFICFVFSFRIKW